jgi:ankyrin repeat protein
MEDNVAKLHAELKELRVAGAAADMYTACCRGHLEVCKWLHQAGAAAAVAARGGFNLTTSHEAALATNASLVPAAGGAPLQLQQWQGVGTVAKDVSHIVAMLSKHQEQMNKYSQSSDEPPPELVREFEKVKAEYDEVLRQHLSPEEAKGIAQDVGVFRATGVGGGLNLAPENNKAPQQPPPPQAADITKANKYGQTLMFDACFHSHLDVCKWLHQAGAAADITKADKYGQTPMLVACSQGHLDVCKWLHQAGAAADITKANNNGFTPMSIACQNGHLSLCQWLHHAGATADITKADNDGYTPMFIACR